MMSFAFLRKALGIKKGTDDKDFEEFVKYFDTTNVSCTNHLLKCLKKKSVRFIVMKNEGRKVIYDSNPSKDYQKVLPHFTFGSQNLSIFDIAFGSYFLNTSKDLLFSTKVHDLSSNGYLLITRVVADIDEWRASRMFGRRSSAKRPNCSSSVPQLINRSETTAFNSVAACLLINIDCNANSLVMNAPKGSVSSSGTMNRRNTSVFVPTNDRHPCALSPSSGQRQFDLLIKRFYYLLFAHCAHLSLLVEHLVDSTLLAICQTCRGRWGTTVPLSETQCTEVIAKSYANFLISFRDMLSPKLHFPLWMTFNNVLANSNDGNPVTPIEHSQFSYLNPWLNLNTDNLPNSASDSSMASYDALTTMFLRSCFSPLFSRGGKEHRYFLGQLVTGVLTLHPGWVSDFATSQSQLNKTSVPITPLHLSGCTSTPNMLLEQLLTQAGCLNLNLESLGGAIFNCTVLSGQSRKYLMALLYFTTYFLRFVSLVSSNECVPDLGKADLFELEHQRRRSRMTSKTRRQSGSALSIGGEAPDSGISSQEDLTVSLYSASTGSSPTHASGMALCMPHRLTRDQCRLAEAAAQLIVAREANAAAAAAAAAMTNVLQPTGPPAGAPGVLTATATTGATRPTTDNSAAADNPNLIAAGFGTGSSASQTRYTEVPLLIEKFVEGPSDQCACIATDLFPGHNASFSTSTPFMLAQTDPTPIGASLLFSFRPISDSAPVLSTGLVSSQTSSPTSGTSPKVNASSVGAAQTGQTELARGGHLLGMGHIPVQLNQPASTMPLYASFEQPAACSVTNHNLVGASVSDHFSSGLVLQATLEQPDSFRERLEDQLERWLRLGPLIIRGMNLSTRKTMMTPTPTPHSDIRIHSRGSHGKQPLWHSSALLVNADNRSVEVLTLRQNAPKDSSTSIDLGPTLARLNQRVSRHSFSQATNSWTAAGVSASSGPDLASRDPFSLSSKRNSVVVDRLRMVPVQAAPLVTRLLEQIHLIYERTNCAALALRDLEGGLQLIYQKSRILADLLTHTGPSLLQHPDRMAAAAGCATQDLPLLLSTASSYCLPAATVLHSHFPDWWFS